MSKIQIKWVPEALLDVERLYLFLYKNNPAAGKRAAQTIMDATDFLKLNPLAGQPMADRTGRREWFALFGAGAFVLRYRLENARNLVIIRVWHSREDRQL